MIDITTIITDTASEPTLTVIKNNEKMVYKFSSEYSVQAFYKDLERVFIDYHDLKLLGVEEG